MSICLYLLLPNRTYSLTSQASGTAPARLGVANMLLLLPVQPQHTAPTRPRQCRPVLSAIFRLPLAVVTDADTLRYATVALYSAQRLANSTGLTSVLGRSSPTAQRSGTG